MGLRTYRTINLDDVHTTFILLVSLVAIYLRLDIGKATIALKGRIAVHLLFSVYLGWITVAAIAK